MKVTAFLGYLMYRECEEIEKHRIHVVYHNKWKPELVASVPLPKDGTIHPYTIYDICNALGIDMPDIYEDVQKDLDRLRYLENEKDNL